MTSLNTTKRCSPRLPAKSKRRNPIFVVHKHAATHLHYDFRLEMDGVLKSWAVPKGPSMNSKDKRLAVMVPDHELAYAKFQGVIPEGQYGAGKVEIWDTGTYTLTAGSIRSGELIVDLKGKKLKGSFALVRMKKTKNWLLIKKREKQKYGSCSKIAAISSAHARNAD